MNDSNPFEEDGSNPFFETTKVKSVIDEDVVFGGQNADEPIDDLGGSGGAPAAGSSPAATTSTTSNSALLFSFDDNGGSGNKEDDEAKPINFDDESAKAADASSSSQGEVNFEDKAVGTASKLLFEENDDDNEAQGEEGGSGPGKRPRRKWYNFWKPSFYQPYFDVDTRDVLRRCLAGLIPAGKPFFERVQGNPDFYGPFWITTTVLFLLAICSNFAEYIAYWLQNAASHWKYDFAKVSIGAAVFYGFLILVPLLIWVLQRFVVKAKLTPIQIYCVYGYSFTAFLIATPFCIAPIEWVRYLVIIAACVISCICIVVSFVKAFQHDLTKGIIVIVVALLLHVALSITYKVYFFSRVAVPESFSSSLPAQQ